MDADAVVSWKHRVRDGEISALQTAENLLLESGDQFWAEYQNDPKEITDSQYEVTADMVCAHTIDLPRLQVPASATVLVGHTDINRTGLHWCVASFDQAMSGHAVAYGCHPQRGDLWPENAPEQVKQVAIFQGLKALCDTMAATAFMRGTARVKPGILFVDASFESDTVHRFCTVARYPFRVVPAIGRAAHRYRWSRATLVGQPFEGGHFQRPQSRLDPYCVFNADFWRETMQRAFLGVPGQPGGFTLHHVEDRRQHKPFAEHIVAEKLSNKYATDQGLRWEWVHKPGSEWDWGDALTGCWVGAAASGLTTSGIVVKPKVYVETRKSKVEVTE